MQASGRARASDGGPTHAPQSLLCSQRGTAQVSGGPGVGKTEVVRAIVRSLEERNQTVRLVAPTARAAQVQDRDRPLA